MKNSLSIQALISGLKDGGVDFATAFPGGPSYGIFEGMGGNQISLNERVAMEVAVGASLAGRRSVVAFKGAGMNACADVFLHSVISGVNAGLVVVLFDDIEAQASPERQDSRSYSDIFGGLWLEPSSIEEAYNFGRNAGAWSERLDVPVVIRLTNQFLKLSGEYTRLPALTNTLELEHDRSKYISYWKRRNDNLKLKQSAIREFVADNYSIRVVNKDSETGIIMLGNCHAEREKYGVADTLQLSTYPLPEKIIKEFSDGRRKLIILEQGNDFGSEKIKALLNEKTDIISDTGREPDNSGEWQINHDWEKMFSALKSIGPDFVVGDEGSFTDESTATIEFCLCMGSSIGVAMGVSMVRNNYAFAITGDCSFQFSGQQTLIEAIHRGVNFCVVVLDNGGAHSVGDLSIIGDIYDVGKVEKTVVDYENTTVSEFKALFESIKERNKLSILYVRK